MLERLRWSAIGGGFLLTAVCALGVRPVLAHFGFQLQAGPVDMLTMVSILLGAFVAGKFAGNIEGIHGATVAVLYIMVIYVGSEVLGEIHLAHIVGLQGLGKLEKWSNLGRDFYYFVAGALGGLLATPFNARENKRTNDFLRTAPTLSRRNPNKAADSGQ